MNNALKYLILLFFISYIISELCCLDYSFYEGYTGFINKYEIVNDPSKAGSIDIIDDRFHKLNEQDRLSLFSRHIMKLNNSIASPYKAGSIDLQDDYLLSNNILPKKEPSQIIRKIPKRKIKQIPSKYAPYETILPKKFRTEQVQYIDQRQDVKDIFSPQIKRDFKDEKDLEEVKERSELGREIISENDCKGSWSEWNIDNCGKENNFCGIKSKVYKVEKPEVSNEKGDGKPCPFKDGHKRYAYCKGNNHVERCGYEQNLCNCKLNENTVISFNGENYYELQEESEKVLEASNCPSDPEDCESPECTNCSDIRVAIREEMEKESPNYALINQKWKEMQKYIVGVGELNPKPCNLSTDINCECPAGYQFKKIIPNPSSVCTFENGGCTRAVDDNIPGYGIDGCIYKDGEETGGEETCSLAPMSQTERSNFIKKHLESQGKCVKIQCKCDNGTPEDISCPSDGVQRCKMVPCDPGYIMKWSTEEGANVCVDREGARGGNCPFGTPDPSPPGNRAWLNPWEINCGSCHDGSDLRPLRVSMDTGQYEAAAEVHRAALEKYNGWLAGERGWGGLVFELRTAAACAPSGDICTVVLPPNSKVKAGAGVSGCEDESEGASIRDCQHLYECMPGFAFKPSSTQKYRNDTSLRMVECNTNDNTIFNGTCERVRCQIPPALKNVYSIPPEQTMCSSDVQNCGLTNLQCTQTENTVDGVTPSLVCRTPFSLPYDFNEDTPQPSTSLFSSGCESRILGEVTEDHTPASILELMITTNDRVVITGQDGDNWQGYVVGRSNIKGSFPKSKVTIIGDITDDINQELSGISTFETLSTFSLDKGLTQTEIDAAENNFERLRSILMRKLIEEDVAERLRISIQRQEQREQTLESIQAEERLRQEDQANIINQANTIDETNISNRLCAYLSPDTDRPLGVESISYQGGGQSDEERMNGIEPGTQMFYRCEDGKEFWNESIVISRRCGNNGIFEPRLDGRREVDGTDNENYNDEYICRTPLERAQRDAAAEDTAGAR